MVDEPAEFQCGGASQEQADGPARSPSRDGVDFERELEFDYEPTADIGEGVTLGLPGPRWGMLLELAAQSCAGDRVELLGAEISLPPAIGSLCIRARRVQGGAGLEVTSAPQSASTRGASTHLVARVSSSGPDESSELLAGPTLVPEPTSKLVGVSAAAVAKARDLVVDPDGSAAVVHVHPLAPHPFCVHPQLVDLTLALARLVTAMGSEAEPIRFARLTLDRTVATDRGLALRVRRSGQQGEVSVQWVDEQQRTVLTIADLVLAGPPAQAQQPGLLLALRITRLATDALDCTPASIDADILLEGASSLDLVRMALSLHAELGVATSAQEIASLRTPRKIADALQARVLGASESDGPRPLTAGERSWRVRASAAQRQFWVLERLETGSARYHLHFRARWHGALDWQCLQRSCRALELRHEILTTVFEHDETDLWQYPRAGLAGSMTEEDLSANPARAHVLEMRAERSAREPFDLEKGPVYRVDAVRMAVDEHVLLFTFHHVAIDGWAVEQYFAELKQTYEAYVRGVDPKLRPPAVDYADASEWLRSEVEGARGEEHRAYWIDALRDLAPLDLPTVAETRSATGDFVVLDLPLHLADRLRATALRGGTTLFAIVAAAYAYLLSRYSGENDIAIGTTTTGRYHPALATILGPFVNAAILRVSIDPAGSFSEVLRNMHDAVFGALAHERLPFDEVLRATSFRRAATARPFDVAILWQSWTLPAHVGDATVEWQVDGLDGAPAGTARFGLELAVAETGRELRGELKFRCESFARDLVADMARRLRELLELVSVSSAIPLSQIAFRVPPPQTGVPEAPTQRSFLERFHDQVACNGEAPAIISDGTIVTYTELASRARGLRGVVQESGVRHGDLVLLALDRGPELVASMLGVLEAGGCFVAVDPDTPAGRVESAAREIGIRHLVTTTDALSKWDAASWRTICVDGVTKVEASERERTLGSTDLAFGVFTSGSTGSPKLVLLEHGGLSNLVDQQLRIFGLAPGDRLLHIASPSFDACIAEIVAALASGSTLWCVPRDAALGGAALADFLQRARISFAKLTPSVLATVSPRELSDLRLLAVAGERCPRDLVDRWAVGRRFLNLYGPAEATVWSTVDDCAAGREPTLGRPIGNVTVHVLDPQLRIVPFGMPGEIAIGGKGVGRGYAVAPPSSRERFCVDPYSREHGGRLFRTGDRGVMLQDGRIRFLGRFDDQAKLRGVRIEPADVEQALLTQANVRAAAAVVRGDGIHAALVAFVELHRAESRAGRRLRSALRRVVPRSLVPSAIFVVGSLPHLPSGKIDRRTLKSISIADAGEAADAELRLSWAEERVVDAFSEVLALSADVRAHVSADSDFFELGGHSLLVVNLVTEILSRTAVELSPSTILAASTVAEIAALIETGGEAPWTGLRELIRQDTELADFSVSSVERASRPDTILVTGATGFLGAHVAAGLAEAGGRVICLLRGESEALARRRLRQRFADLGLNLNLVDRLAILTGDLRDDDLGLSAVGKKLLAEEVQSIVHGAAEISLTLPYTRLRPTNVEGTRRLLKLGSVGRPKAFHYISSISVVTERERASSAEVLKVDAGDPVGLSTGYAQTKGVAENLVCSARRSGLRATVYRPARIWANSTSLALPADDIWMRFIRGCVELRAAPQVDFWDNLVHVDYVARVLIGGVLRPQVLPDYVHIGNAQRTHLRELVTALRSLGRVVDEISQEAWLGRLEESPSLAPLADFLRRHRPLEWTCPTIDTRAATKILGGHDGACPVIDAMSIARVLEKQLLPK